MHKIVGLIAALFLSGCGGIETWIHDDVDTEFVTQTFTAEQLHQDLDFLLETMSARHPAYDQYVNEFELHRHAEQLKQQINQPMTRKQSFALFAQLTPYFNDGHSILFPLLAETTYIEQEGEQIFPLAVGTQNGDIRLSRSYTKESDGVTLYKGTQITSINNISAKELLDTLTQMSHGETPLLRESMLSLLFPYWLSAVFDIHGDISIGYMRSGLPSSVTLRSNERWVHAQNEREDYELQILASDVGYLRVASFDVDGDENAYTQFVEESFKTLAKEQITKLLIDVRGNTGGQSEAGAEIIQYLIDKPVTQASLAIEKLNADNNGWLGFRGAPGEIIELDVSDDGTIAPIQADKRFNGDVVVMMDRMTYSAGILFVTTIKDNKLGQLVGEPTGGFANQTGNLTPFYLPNTKLLMLAPARYIVRPSGDRRKQAVIPNVKLKGERLSAEDQWLNQALDVFTEK